MRAPSVLPCDSACCQRHTRTFLSLAFSVTSSRLALLAWRWSDLAVN